MTGLALDLQGAAVLWPDGTLSKGALSLADGRICHTPIGRSVDLSGFCILPGIVDAHGDAFERHLAPRRGVMTDMTEGVLTTEAELAAAGITTAVMAQFWSWEGGLRAPDYAAHVFAAISEARPQVATSLIGQLRFEISMLDDYAELPNRIAEWDVQYVVFNDHLPHDRLSEGRRPPRLTGQALKAGRNPERHFQMMLDLHANHKAVPKALDELCAQLRNAGLLLGSHDDQTPDGRADWRARGVTIVEFPETREVAESARDAGEPVIIGAPNLMRGSSHKGNVSAAELVSDGLCDALASDYHYPSVRRAAQLLVRSGRLETGAAWDLVSYGPAQALGLTDRGRLSPGWRADLVVLEAESGRVAATIAGGQVSYMAGEIAERFLV